MHATISPSPPGGESSSFAGFTPEFFSFLRELERHNDTTWFAGNRERFEEHVRAPALAFVRAVAPGLASACPPLVADDRRSRGSLARMHRDTRFTTNKRPYHTSVVLRFAHGSNDARTAPVATLRLTSQQIVIGAGVRPGGAQTLGLVRAAIDTYRERWAAVRADRTMRATFGDLVPPELVRVPGGWPPDHPFADDLRRKAFHVLTELPTTAAHDAVFARQAVAAWAAATPLLVFVSTALGLPWDAAGQRPSLERPALEHAGRRAEPEFTQASDAGLL